MDELYACLIVFVTGMLGIWKAVPAGIVLEVPPLWIFVFTTGGALLAAVLLYFFGEVIRKQFFSKYQQGSATKKGKRARRLFEKYGLPGLGFFGTLLLGPNITLIIGLVIVQNRKQLLLWTMAGIVIWTFVLTFTAGLGITLFDRLNTPG